MTGGEDLQRAQMDEEEASDRAAAVHRRALIVVWSFVGVAMIAGLAAVRAILS